MRAPLAITLTAALVAAGAGSARLAAAPPKPPSSITVAVPGLGCSTDTFEARAWSWGARNLTDTSGGGGSGAGKSVVSAMSLTRVSDGCSPPLLAHVMTGRHIPAVTLTQFGSNGAVTTTVELTDAIISSWQVGGSNAAAEATENVEISFNKFLLTDVASGNKFCWDVSQNKGC